MSDIYIVYVDDPQIKSTFFGFKQKEGRKYLTIRYISDFNLRESPTTMFGNQKSLTRPEFFLQTI